MKLVTLQKYVPHPSFREPNLDESPVVHAMKRGPVVVVDVNAFLNAEPVFSDAVYPDEPCTGVDALVSVWFAKGGTCTNIETKASELTRVLGRNSIPAEWICR